MQCRSLHLFKFLQALFARKIQADLNLEQRKIGTRKEIAIRDPELEVTTMSSGNDSEQKSVDQSTQVYEGNCHCKAVLFSAILPTKLAAVSCNCEYLQEPYLTRFHTPAFAYQISHSIGDRGAKYQIGSYCHASGSLHAFADDIEIHQGAQSLKVRTT